MRKPLLMLLPLLPQSSQLDLWIAMMRFLNCIVNQFSILWRRT